MISQFSYGYDAEGQITSWQQNNSGFVAASSGSNSFGLNYDAASQLNWATLTGPGGSVTSYSYGFDKAGNRTQEQINSTTTTSSYNGLNQLLGQSAGGLTQFRGTLSKWATVTVGGNPATVSGTGPTYQFEGAANLPAATTSTVQIVATATSGVSGTNNYQVVVAGGSGPTMSYDADGEMTSNGAGQHYQWDAANRLAQIWYGPIGNSPSTTFTYNGLGQRVAIIENDASGNTITKQFVWCPADAQPSEERDGSNIRRFYPQGEQINGANYFFTRDHLGSVREMMDSTGSAEGLQVRYNYDLWGRETKMYGANDTLDADFDYAGYYQHQPSGLNLTMFRAYNPNLARWISRDPIAERGGINLYGYVFNNPISLIDPLGLSTITVNGTPHQVNNGTDLANMFNSIRAGGTPITNFVYDGHGDEQGEMILNDSGEYLPSQAWQNLLRENQDLFNPDAKGLFNACSSASGGGSMAQDFKDVLQSSDTWGYNGYYSPFLNMGIGNSGFVQFAQTLGSYVGGEGPDSSYPAHSSLTPVLGFRGGPSLR